MNNLIIAMSGGTTTVINSTLAGIIKQAKKSEKIDKIYAGYPGIQGILEESIVDITDLNDSDLKALRQTPTSSFIGATRIAPLKKEEFERLKSIFKKHQIKFFLNIGGNGTVKQSIEISKRLGNEFKIASLPKTVDNDFGDKEFKKMYFTPGFPSCLNYWVNKIWLFNQENKGACQHDKVLVAQTFGRETGFIAGTARLADPERKLPLVILLPEDQKPIHEVIEEIKRNVKEKGRAIVVLSEGYKVKDFNSVKDLSGQIMYSSSENLAAQLLVNVLVKEGISSRAFIPGFDQRDEINFTLKKDIEIAEKIGEEAILLFDKGENNFLIGTTEKTFVNNELVCIQLSECNNYSRKMPENWIEKNKFDVSDKYIKYLESIYDKETILLERDKKGKPFFIQKKHLFIKI